MFYVGSKGYYWSSTRVIPDAWYFYVLGFAANGIDIFESQGCYGYAVRLVK